MKDNKTIREALMTLLREHSHLKKKWHDLLNQEVDGLTEALLVKIEADKIEERGRALGAMTSALAWMIDEPLMSKSNTVFNKLLELTQTQQAEEGRETMVPDEFATVGNRPAYNG